MEKFLTEELGTASGKEITVAATLEHAGELTEFIDSFLEENDCPMKIQMAFDIALDEIFSNICYYAYPEGEVGESRLFVGKMSDSDGFCLTFVDWGTPYNPLEKEDPDTTLGAEERGIGGLGIFMVKKSMSHMIYEYKDGMNLLYLVKQL